MSRKKRREEKRKQRNKKIFLIIGVTANIVTIITGIAPYLIKLIEIIKSLFN